jgi:pectate lyase
MKNFFLAYLLIVFSSCHAQQQSTKDVPPDNNSIAFPGAEGFGKYTTGGRGGKVLIVSNLNDGGPGSFREAAEAKGKRIIVFAVSGTIHLESKLSIRGDATIAGQTAPGDGICLADHGVSLGGNNIIVRYLRFRMGDKFQNEGMTEGAGDDDAFGGVGRKNIIVDHCSVSWSTDEAFSVYAGDSTTLQWNLVSEPLNYSYHFEKGDTDFERHGYGGIWGGRHLSAHHNLFAHCNNRNPRFNGIRTGTEEFVDYYNNVIYNWGGNNIYAGEGGNYNLINNYFKWGPSTHPNTKSRIVNPGKWENPPIPFGKFYVRGNYVDGAPDVSENNWLGVHMGNNGTAEDKKNSVIEKPFPGSSISAQPAKQAFDDVLRFAGASYKRDTLDERIINDVKNRTGKLIDVQGGHPHGTAYEKTINAWPGLKSHPAPGDSDQDGIPDDWEKKNGLDSSDATDALAYKLTRNFTNIEVYINSLVR